MPETMKQAARRSREPDVLDRPGHLDPRHDPRCLGDHSRRRRLQGGSTITQQYIKILYLNSEQTLTRKFRELFLAYKINKELSKEEILAGYLNTIYFGHGAYGVQAASKAYFDVDAKKLNVPQAALLATVVNNPNMYDPSDEGQPCPHSRVAIAMSCTPWPRWATSRRRRRRTYAKKLPKFPKTSRQPALRRPQGLPAQDGRARAQCGRLRLFPDQRRWSKGHHDL